MTSERFESLDEELCELLLEVENVYAEKLPLCRGAEKEEIIAEIQSKLDFCTRAIFDMESEAHMAPPAFRTDMMELVRKHRNSVQRISALIQRSKGGIQAKPNYHTGGSTGIDIVDENVRQAVMEGRSALDRTAQSLTRATRVAVETETIGNEVLNELGQQRDSLIRTRDRLHDTNVEITKTRRILRAMQLRILTNKCILFLIILLEAAILAGLVYYKFFT